MENNNLYPHYVTTAIMVVNPKLAQLQTASDKETVIPISIFAIEKDDDVYELPSIRLLPSDGSLLECAARCVEKYFGSGTIQFSPDGLKEVKTYMVPGDESVPAYMITAFEIVLVPVDSQNQMPRPLDLSVRGVWRGLNAMQYSMMNWNHNVIISDIIKSYISSGESTYESSLKVLSQPSSDNYSIRPLNTFTAATGKKASDLRGLKDSLDYEQQRTFISNLQEMGFHIYPHMHMEVATDVVAFGYYYDDKEDENRGKHITRGKKKDEKKKDELSVLLVKRAESKNDGTPVREAGKWALPGCFLKGDKTAVEAARESLFVEGGLSGLNPTEIHPLKPFTDPNRDHDENVPVISLPYFWITKKVNPDYANSLHSSKSTTSFQWFPIKRILYAGHDKDSETMVRFDDTVLIKGENGVYIKSGGKTVKPRFLRDGYGNPVTNVYIKNGYLWIEYFVDEPFETKNSEGIDNSARLAFDHAEIIVSALDELKEQSHFKPLLSGLLPPRFKLITFQRLWEALLWPWMFEPSNFQKGIKIDDQDRKEKKKALIRHVEDPSVELYELDQERYIALLEDNISVLK